MKLSITLPLTALLSLAAAQLPSDDDNTTDVSQCVVSGRVPVQGICSKETRVRLTIPTRQDPMSIRGRCCSWVRLLC